MSQPPHLSHTASFTSNDAKVMLTATAQEIQEADDLANLAEVSVGAPATTEMIKQVVENTWSQIGYIKEEKHVDVMHKGKCLIFEVSTKTTSDFHSELHRKFHLNAAVRGLFRVESDGSRAFAAGVDDAPKFSPEMDKFFATLKDEYELDPCDIENIRAVFAAQRIKFKQLMAVGEFAITDEKLEKFGIKEYGLRTDLCEIKSHSMNSLTV
ncbi:hypothetical protein BJ741DRAFT_576896 [Chytriomyces cf. hyalinus JEL632]|nr:hypothetical protein BJ741DRAFT_576896 [Chytriomyces cf. hyalinus JEL632]